MTHALVALLIAAGPATSPDPWWGADKLKHFLVSAFVQSVVFSGARAAGVNRDVAQVGAGSVTMAVGVWKEVRDRRVTGRFSARDLGWDAAGALAAAALLNGAR